MKKLAIIIGILIPVLTNAQVAFSPLIEQLIQQTNGEALSQLDKELSGYVPTTVQGEAYTFASRHADTEGNEKAAYWIKEHFEELGLDTRFMDYSETGRNVIATIQGSVYPEKEYIICAHYDAMPAGAMAPGADDNASGVCAVLEAARLLKDYESVYTLKFIGFDEEELGLWGSEAYADSAVANNEDILGVINLDMIAWDSNNDNKMSIATNDNSAELTNDYVDIYTMYVPQMSNDFISTTASDHSPFWNQGYPAILAIEEYPGDFHDYYHTPQDNFDNINVTFFTNMTRVAIASLASLGWDYKVNIQHQQIVSSNDTGERTAIFEVNSEYEFPQDDNQPRLYYRINNGEFMFLHPYSIDNNTYTFMIPEQPLGTIVEYYFALQDESASIIASLPAGSKGTNPPGTIAPSSLFSYTVDNIYFDEFESESGTVAINDLEQLYDTIHVEEVGNLIDLNVRLDIEHSYNSDLKIELISPDNVTITLSQSNGGGSDNYTNTLFDDEAEASITSGTGPFTGSFRPQSPLSEFDNSQIQGDWVLAIYDNYNGDSGTLLGWALEMQYTLDHTPVNLYADKGFNLHQNFPNPTNGSTEIHFELPEKSKITINLYDISGRLVETLANGNYPHGLNQITFNTSNLKPGTYFYRFSSEKHTATKKMIIQ